MSMAPIIAGSLVYWMPKGRQKGPIGALEAATLIRTPEPRIKADHSYQAVIDALTVVVEARTELELVGSQGVLAEASKLIAACAAFADVAGRSQWPWQLGRMDQHRILVTRARESYIRLVKTSEGQRLQFLSRHRTAPR